MTDAIEQLRAELAATPWKARLSNTELRAFWLNVYGAYYLAAIDKVISERRPVCRVVAPLSKD